MGTRKKQPGFEESLGELESLVERMETGDLSLDESLSAFERGVALTRACQNMLQVAEQKVEILTASKPDAATEPFSDDA